MPLRRSMPFAIAFLAIAASSLEAQGDGIASRVARIADRPEFRHALIGVKVTNLAGDSVLFSLNADKLFVPGSTTKLLTAGTALELLGPDHRFHTRVYRTGPVSGGTLNGDLVLAASGDPNLSHRIRGDSLLFVDEDHSYGSDAVTDLIPGDPLLVMRELAAQIKAKGIRRIAGSVRVDASLFDANERELGTGVMISPIVLNDNIVDLVVGPGARPGDPAKITVLPASRYLRIVNRVTTAAAGGRADGSIASDSLGRDGVRAVVLTGTVPLGASPALITYKVPDPARYAAMGLCQALEDVGVVLAASPGRRPAPGPYADERMVAEHVSPPFREAAKVILKVSQNLHASMMPFVLGATLGKGKDAQAGFDLEREFLTKAGLDLSGAVQSDGAGGAALYTPDFMTAFLSYMARQKSGEDFIRALPILGRDGTLARISRDAPAAGHVFAKTGTFVDGDLLNRGLVVQGKGLAGYLTTRSGRRLVIAIYINRVKLQDPAKIQEVVGQANGDIAAAIYDAVP